MTMRYEIPASVTLLAQLLEPLQATLHNRLRAQMPTSTQPTLPALSRAQVKRLFLGIRSFAVEVTWLLNTKIAPLAAQENSKPAQLKSAVDRLTGFIEAQLRRYDTVLSSQDASGEGLNDLLAEAYRHNLCELQDWMGDLIRIAHDPEPFLASEHSAKITLLLEFTNCPELERLREYVMPARINYKSETSPITAPSLLAQLGWLILGIGFIQWLFGLKDGEV